MRHESGDPEPVAWKTFLETYQPYRRASVSHAYSPLMAVLLGKQERDRGPVAYLHLPLLDLSCDRCGDFRIFEGTGPVPPLPERQDSKFDSYGFGLTETTPSHDFFLTYTCRNCQQTTKVYAIRLDLPLNALRGDEPAHQRKPATLANLADWDDDGEAPVAFKFGEWPALHPQVPSRVLAMVGEDQDLFRKGRRAEAQGLGIGAFGYYRRVVTNQKDRLFGEILKVAERVGASKDVKDKIARAQKEWKFTQAVDDVPIPKELLIEGQNPLKLLHNTVSDGLHDRSDEECLQLAEAIRVVLAALANRVTETLADQAQLRNAVALLVRTDAQRRQQRSLTPAGRVSDLVEKC